MSNRDLLLVMNMLYVMTERESDPSQDQRVSQFKNTLRTLVEGGTVAPATDPAEMQHLEKRVAELEKQNKSLAEELGSHRQMLQMTIMHLDGSLREAQALESEAIHISDKLFDNILNTPDKLQLVFPESFFYSHADRHFVYMSNRIGITYLVVVSCPWEGLLAASFKMSAYLILHQIINEKRFINSSHLIEEFEQYYMRFDGLSEQHRERLKEIGVSVFVVDKNRFEAEFASNGPDCCFAYKNTLEVVKGGRAYAEKSRDPLEVNTYKTSHLNIREQSKFYLSSIGFEEPLTAAQGQTTSLQALLTEACAKDMPTQQQVVTNFFHSHQANPTFDILLLGLKF